MLRLRLARYVVLGIAVALMAAAAGAASAVLLVSRANAQPEPTIELLPASGPCDAQVEVRGSGFAPPANPGGVVEIYLLEPGTTAVNAGVYYFASVGADGAFSSWAPMRKYGCEAAARDSQGQQPSGELTIAVSSGGTNASLGERLPDIIAVAQYRYTTTMPHADSESLVIEPTSGPCDATIEVRLSGFRPDWPVPIDVAGPYSDQSMGLIAIATTDANGEFAGQVTLGEVGCQAASLDKSLDSLESPTEWLEIYAGLRRDVLFVAARASYTYTTTESGGVPAPRTLPAGQASAQPEPTIELLPASGPCDAALEVKGSGFEPPLRQTDPPVRLYLVQPDTADISMSTTLNLALPAADGTFSVPVRFFELRCEAAALDSQAEQPSGHLRIAVSSVHPPVRPGELIPDVIARAEYAYTTTATRPGPTLIVSPSRGPCDATVEVSGSGFGPAEAILLELQRPFSDGTMGLLRSAVPDSRGDFSVSVALGALGCEAARLYGQFSHSPEPGLLSIVASPEAPPATPPQGIPGVLAFADYSYTTASLAGGPTPQALPATGSGPGAAAGPSGWLVLIGPLAGLGLVLVMASLYRSRSRV